MASGADKAAAGLGVAAGVVQAVPVFGQIAGAFIGLGAGLAKMFGKKKKKPTPPPQRKLNQGTQELAQGTQTVAAGTAPLMQQETPQLGQAIVAPLPAQPIPTQTSAAAPQQQEPQPLPYAQKRDAWLSQALMRNRG